MASGSNNLTTYYAKRIIGDTNAQTSATALLQTGTGIATDLWILGNTVHDTYGIRYSYDGDNSHDKLQAWGGGNAATAWVQLDNGNTYILGQVGIGYDPNTSGNTYKLYVNGTSYLKGDTTIVGNVSFGASNTSNYISIHGLTGDAADTQWANHYFIGNRHWGSTESSELVLFAGNDVGNGNSAITASGSGPDRIRLIAGAHVFQTYSSAVSGTFETVCTSSALVNIFEVNTNRVVTHKSIYIDQPSTARRNGIVGTYDYTKAAAIWAMGDSYQIATDGSSLGSLYGAAYVYQGQGGTGGKTLAGGHQFVWAENGGIDVALGGNGVWIKKNGGIYWDPYVESASDASDVSRIIQVASGVAGGTELQIYQANDAADVINLWAPNYIYLKSKRAFTISDSWLRINEDKGFSSGIYTGSSLIRTDNQLQVGSSGSAFYANSSGDGKVSRDFTAGRYLYCAYVNESCGAETPADGSYWIYANSDGWLRKSTRANASAKMDLDHRWVRLAGDTMTGRLTLLANQYGTTGALNCNNSNIVGVNDIRFSDNAESYDEGIMFVNGGAWDCMAASGGNFFFRGGTDGTPALSAANSTAGIYCGSLYTLGTITCSQNNATGGGIKLADDGDIVDLNDGYCSMRFSYGVRIFSANKGGSAKITLHSNGLIYQNSNGVTFTIGAQNNGWVHLYNDKGVPFIFNNTVCTTGGDLGNTSYKWGTGYFSGEVKSWNANGFRLAYGSYGVILRNDGSDYYFLLTASGSAATGSWNSLRPFRINLGTGYVYIGHNMYTSHIIPGSGCRIGGSGGALYLGNSGNQSWVYTQDIASQSGESYWKIYTNGNAHFKASVYATQFNGHGNAVLRASDGSGWFLQVQTDGNLVLYNSSGQPKWSTGTSTKYVKQNIHSITDADISAFMHINPVSFYYRPEMNMLNNGIHYGVIAEELINVYPNLVEIPENYDETKFDINKGFDQPLVRVDYEQFIPLLIKMVQNQQRQIEKLEKRIKCD